MTLTNNKHILILEHVGPVFFKWRNLIQYPLEYDHHKLLIQNYPPLFLYRLKRRIELIIHSTHGEHRAVVIRKNVTNNCQLVCWHTDCDMYDVTQARQHHHLQWREDDKYILLQYVIPRIPQVLV